MGEKSKYAISRVSKKFHWLSDWSLKASKDSPLGHHPRSPDPSTGPELYDQKLVLSGQQLIGMQPESLVPV